MPGLGALSHEVRASLRITPENFGFGLPKTENVNPNCVQVPPSPRFVRVRVHSISDNDGLRLTWPSVSKIPFGGYISQSLHWKIERGGFVNTSSTLKSQSIASG